MTLTLSVSERTAETASSVVSQTMAPLPAARPEAFTTSGPDTLAAGRLAVGCAVDLHPRVFGPLANYGLRKLGREP